MSTVYLALTERGMWIPIKSKYPLRNLESVSEIAKEPVTKCRVAPLYYQLIAPFIKNPL